MNQKYTEIKQANDEITHKNKKIMNNEQGNNQ